MEHVNEVQFEKHGDPVKRENLTPLRMLRGCGGDVK